ncbi:flippase [Rhizobium sp. G187]|uniref:flippase n=1 Tax=unclassified Rhizobium TaxID=2613769 RepID=UPI0006B8924F|nr:flippase [Rhizobium sp. AAP43]KPF41116.1 hypothetical protein IP76_22375 [Rhizobium sp. AAP43]
MATDAKPRNRLYINFLVNLIGAVAPIPVLILTVPLYIHHVGDARYGVISLIWVMITYLSFLELGLAPATIKALAGIDLADKRERARVIVTSFSINATMTFFGAFLLYLLSSYIVGSVVEVPVELEGEIKTAMPWIALLLPLVILNGAGIDTLEAREAFKLANVLQVSGTIFAQILPLAFAIFISPDLGTVIPGAVIARVILMVAIMIAIRWLEGPIRITDFDPLRARKLLSYGGWVTISSILSPILGSLDQLMIGRFFGVATVTYYSVPLNLITRSQILPGAISRAIFPRLASSEADDASALSARVLIVTALLYGGVCASTILLMDPLLTLWLGDVFTDKASLPASLLVSSIWFNALIFAPYFLLHSQHRPDLIAKLHLGLLIPFAVVLIILTKEFGLVGAATAAILRTMVDFGGQLALSRILGRVFLKLTVPAAMLAAATLLHALYGTHWVLMLVSTCLVWPLIAVILFFQDRATFDLLLGIAQKPMKYLASRRTA